MRRFFVPPDSISEDRATITGELFRHMVKVLRLKPGAEVILSDGEGHEFAGVIGEIGKETAWVAIHDKVDVDTVAGRPWITLYQGLPKGDKMELILQKTTELGVAEIIPFAAARSVAVVRNPDSSEKVVRWQRIVREAARQSGRTFVPPVLPAKDMAAAVNLAHQSVRLLLWEEEKVNRLKDVLAAYPVPDSVALIIGPEGGLTPEEATIAKDAGFIPVSLGQRIVRTETAGIAMLAILQFYWGDMG